MIPVKFYRDENYVYVNNPNGMTKKMTIEAFEAAFEADVAELPAVTEADLGGVLTVTSDGLAWVVPETPAVEG